MEAFNEALIFSGDERPLGEFIELVTALRASSEFRVSTLLRGFISFRMGLLTWLVPPEVDPSTALGVLQLVDDAYFAAIFRMTDEYVRKLNRTIFERRQALETELAELTTRRIRKLDDARRIIDLQKASPNAVSLPILQVWEGVLVWRASAPRRPVLPASRRAAQRPPRAGPTPPIWIAGLRQESVPHIAAQGLTALLIPYAAFETFARLAETAQRYRDAWRMPMGTSANSLVMPRLACGLHAHCAVTAAGALDEAFEPMARYVRTR